jgi:hypothetical protein
VHADVLSLLSYFGPLLRALTGHEWLLAISLVSSYVVMLLDRDSKFPISLPAHWDENRWKPVAVLVACEVQAVALAVLPAAQGGSGLPLEAALAMGVKAAMWSFGLWALVAKAVYKDKLPRWLLWLSMALPEPQPLPKPAIPSAVLPTVEVQLPPTPIPPPKDPPSPPPAA